MAANDAFAELQISREAGLRELHPLDGALLLMHFAYRGLVVDADRYLSSLGLSRLHHRILYVIARTESLSIGSLLDVLGITKQALHGPIKVLREGGYVTADRDKINYRVKILRLTAKGSRVERVASGRERRAIEAALAAVPEQQQQSWYDVMLALGKNVGH